jgi:Tfp pilus assembly protein PilP
MAAVLMLGLAASASAQAPKAPAKGAAPAPAQPPATTPAAAPAPTTPEKPAVQLPSPPPNYVYSADGRRDPFVNLINRGTDPRGAAAAAKAKRGEGAAGILTSELVVKGIMENRGQFMAMVSGADKKVYTVRPGDRLADGVVRTVTPQAVVILQEVNDPLSLEKQREVRKFLRGGDVK